VGTKEAAEGKIVIPPALGIWRWGIAAAVSPNETMVFCVDLISTK